MITDINHLDFSKKYSYADYLTWHFDEMVELIKGKNISNVSCTQSVSSGSFWKLIWSNLVVFKKKSLSGISGVREYWIVHPHEATIFVYRLDKNGKYKVVQQKPYVKGSQIPVGVFPELFLDADEIFPED